MKNGIFVFLVALFLSYAAYADEDHCLKTVTIGTVDKAETIDANKFIYVTFDDARFYKLPNTIGAKKGDAVYVNIDFQCEPNALDPHKIVNIRAFAVSPDNDPVLNMCKKLFFKE